MFPTTLELVDTERLYGQTLSNCDQSGDPFQIIIEGHPQELQPEGTQASAESELMALKRPITSTYTRTDWKEAEKPTYGPDTNLTELFGKEVRLMAWLLPEDPDVRPPSKVPLPCPCPKHPFPPFQGLFSVPCASSCQCPVCSCRAV